MSYTMQGFRRDYVKEHLPKLTPEELAEVLRSLPPEKLLEALSAEQIKKYLANVTARPPSEPRKPRRKK
jgi:hypothetical protein